MGMTAMKGQLDTSLGRKKQTPKSWSALGQNFGGRTQGSSPVIATQ